GPLYPATAAAFSADGRVLAVGDRFGNVQLFDARTGGDQGAPVLADPAHSLIVAVTFSPNGHTIAAASVSDPVNGAHVIDVATRRTRPLDPPVPFALKSAFSPDGTRLVVASGA